MEICTYIILIPAFIILTIFVTFGYMKFKEIIAEHNNAHKERYCHYCHYAYIHKTHEDYIYCPQCGNRLRAIDDDPFKKAQNGIASDEDYIEMKKIRHKNDKKD